MLVAALCQCGDRAVPVLMAAVLLFDRYPPGLTYFVIQVYVWGDAEAIATENNTSHLMAALASTWPR